MTRRRAICFCKPRRYCRPRYAMTAREDVKPCSQLRLRHRATIMNRHANFWFLLAIDPGSSYSFVLWPRLNAESHLYIQGGSDRKPDDFQKFVTSVHNDIEMRSIYQNIQFIIWNKICVLHVNTFKLFLHKVIKTLHKNKNSPFTLHLDMMTYLCSYVPESIE